MSKLGQNIWNKVKKPITIGQEQKTLGNLIVEKRLGMRLYVSPILTFLLVFPKILSFKSFGSSRGNSYTIFFMLDMKYYFSCSE